MISSARMTLANMGPATKRIRREPELLSSSMTSVPVMSEGMRSGVNWMREKLSDSVRASVLIISVLASPGTPSRMQCPRHKSTVSRSSITASCPTMVGGWALTPDAGATWVPFIDLPTNDMEDHGGAFPLGALGRVVC